MGEMDEGQLVLMVLFHRFVGFHLYRQAQVLPGYIFNFREKDKINKYF